MEKEKVNNNIEVARYLAGDDEEKLANLLQCFAVAFAPFDRAVPLSELADAYVAAGYWFAIAKDKKRRLKVDYDSDDKEVLEAQLAEDTMEALVKGLDKLIMIGSVLAKHGGN